MITIVDYNAGNLTSVKRALDFLDIPACITADPKEILGAERIIIPGVGHAATLMSIIRSRGIDKALREAVDAGIPVLGICVGCQIILSRSEEGPTECLDMIPGECCRFTLKDPALKIPHMGWNRIVMEKPHVLLRHVEKENEFYFVHSYYPVPASPEMVYTRTEYEFSFASAIGRKNLFATQFHPEKSGRPGLEILKNFSAWDGTTC